MIAEAEENAEKDNRVREGIEEKNKFEGYIYSIKNSMQSVKNNISGDDMKALEEAVSDGLAWLERAGVTASKVDYEDKRRQIESVVNPIFTRAYSSPRADQTESSEPVVEEA